MKSELLELCKGLEGEIQKTHEEGVTIGEAERLAAKFLQAMLSISTALQSVDLDSRMKKSGVKAIKAAVYLEAATKGEKKPTEANLQALVDTSELVQVEQKLFDEAETNRDLLQNYLSTFREAHVFYRGVSKGKFE